MVIEETDDLYAWVMTGYRDDPDVHKRAADSCDLGAEIRLARWRLALTVREGDDKGMLAWLSLLHALVRIQSGLSDVKAHGELRELLSEAGAEVLAAYSVD